MSDGGTTWRTERLGWRDARISERHGHWGFNCPAVDLDFVMMEFNHGRPCAVVEYKHCNAPPPEPGHAAYRALVALAGDLPCFVATYDPEDWCFVVYPLNAAAMDHYAHVAGQRITEQRFVRSLHLLRKPVLAAADEAAIAALNDLTQGAKP